MLRSKRDHSDFLNYFIAIMNTIVNFITIIIIIIIIIDTQNLPGYYLKIFFHYYQIIYFKPIKV
jgi:hypothetical protein